MDTGPETLTEVFKDAIIAISGYLRTTGIDDPELLALSMALNAQVMRLELQQIHDKGHCHACGLREVVTYQCTSCPYTFDAPGQYRYFAQGRGHWHVPDDDQRFKKLVGDHRKTHPGLWYQGRGSQHGCPTRPQPEV